MLSETYERIGITTNVETHKFPVLRKEGSQEEEDIQITASGITIRRATDKKKKQKKQPAKKPAATAATAAPAAATPAQ